MSVVGLWCSLVRCDQQLSHNALLFGVFISYRVLYICVENFALDATFNCFCLQVMADGNYDSNFSDCEFEF